MVGIPLLAEAMGETHRAKIAGCMMTGGAVGTFLGAWTYGMVGGFGWRYVFFVGVAPALLLAVCPPAHHRARSFRCRARAAAGRHRAGQRSPRTITNSCVSCHCNFLPGASTQHHCRTTVRPGLAAGDLDDQHLAADDPVADGTKGGVTGADAVPFVSHGIMVWSLGGIAGYVGSDSSPMRRPPRDHHAVEPPGRSSPD